MSIIEQIKAEIERLKEHTAKCGYPGQDEYAEGNKEGRNFICDKLLSFLSTLESEKPVPNNLEEAAKKFIGYDMDCDELRDYEIGISSFIAGAKWQKEQMMKEAVEYEVGMHGEPIKITFDKYVQRARGIWPGDKVRIIIVKED